MELSSKLLNGPIPGENYTTDTKNFPWHRPPQFTNLDEAIEHCIEHIFDDEKSDSFITMLQIGFSIMDVTQMLLISGVGKGLWSVDFAILMAGPVSNVFVLMARGYEIDFDLGIDPEDSTISSMPAFFNASRDVDPMMKTGLDNMFGMGEAEPGPMEQDPEGAAPTPEGGSDDGMTQGGLGSPSPSPDEATLEGMM